MIVNWKKEIQNSNFKWNVLFIVMLVGVIVGFMPIFMNYIENREGVVLNDVLLNALTPIDLSVPIFTIS